MSDFDTVREQLASTSYAAGQARKALARIEAREKELRDALIEALDDVIWFSGVGPLKDTYWETIRDKHMPRWRDLIGEQP